LKILKGWWEVIKDKHSDSLKRTKGQKIIDIVGCKDQSLNYS
jgi:hypothetical protein